MEIERKFLLNHIPFSLDSLPYILIEQGYISTSPVIRIRKKIICDIAKESVESYILTIKSKGFLKRQEYELEISSQEYNALKEKVSGNIITKRRYVIPIDNALSLELDVFNGAFTGLTMGEIEFPDEDEANKYNPPEYLSREVTFDTRFHNSTMSVMSKEDILLLLSLANGN